MARVAKQKATINEKTEEVIVSDLPQVPLDLLRYKVIHPIKGEINGKQFDLKVGDKVLLSDFERWCYQHCLEIYHD